MAIGDVKLEKANEVEVEYEEHAEDPRFTQRGYNRTPGLAPSPHDRARTSSTLSNMTRSTTPPKIDKRLHQHFVSISPGYV